MSTRKRGASELDTENFERIDQQQQQSQPTKKLRLASSFEQREDGEDPTMTTEHDPINAACMECKQNISNVQHFDTTCAHYICIRCLNGKFEEACVDQNKWLPTCSVCNATIDLHDVTDLLDIELVFRCAEKEKEYHIVEKCEVYCAGAGCGKFVGYDYEREDVKERLECIDCGTITCGTCREPWHAPLPCCWDPALHPETEQYDANVMQY